MTASRRTESDTAPAPRRGRPPVEGLAARRRQQIIEAAHDIFCEKGYTATGIEDIAERVGIGHGTVYRYFSSKRDILDHVVDYGIERVVRAVQEVAPLETATTFEVFTEQLRAIAQRLFALIDSDPGIVQVILLEATSIDDELTQRITGLADTLVALSTIYIKHGISRGFLRADLDAEVVAYGLGSLAIPAALRAVRGSFGAEERDRFVRGLVDLLSDGIRPQS
jgi:AcrR family transcriptional regulator